MRAGVPVGFGRPVTTAAQLSALGEGQLPPVPGLEEEEIGFVVTVETVVVAAVLAMPHHDVGMPVPRQFQWKSVFEKQAVEMGQVGTGLALLQMDHRLCPQQDSLESFGFVNTRFSDDRVKGRN